MVKKIVAGNWKMNGSPQDIQSFAQYSQILSKPDQLDAIICPPFPLLGEAKQSFHEQLLIGAQDCHGELAGAHTGDVSAQLLQQMCCSYVIVGHSERRQDHAETDVMVGRKILAAQELGITPIFCIGEQMDQRRAGRWGDVLAQQLSILRDEKIDAGMLVVAYEPIWAIGSGARAENNDIVEAHGFIRAQLASLANNASKIAILYGGSVKPDNVVELSQLADVDGALVGGASLKVEDFSQLVEAFGATL